MSQKVSQLKARLEQAIDPKEYDQIAKDLATEEKRISLEAAQARKDAGAAEAARIQAKRDRLQQHVASIEALKNEFDSARLAIVAGLNLAYTSIEAGHRLSHEIKALQENCMALNQELGSHVSIPEQLPVYFGISPTEDPEWASKTILERYAAARRMLQRMQAAGETTAEEITVGMMETAFPDVILRKHPGKKKDRPETGNERAGE